MTSSELEAALKALCPTTYHGGGPAKNKCIIWQEYRLKAVAGDNGAQLRIPRVQIDAYCQESNAAEPEGFFVSILDTLDSLGLAYDEPDIGYDEDSNMLRCIIQCDLA